MTAQDTTSSISSDEIPPKGTTAHGSEDADNGYESKYTEALLAHRTLLLETAVSRAELFDKSLIAIATGAMALSITFMRFIAPSPVSTYLLFVSWAAFTFSLLLSLLTLQLSQHGIDQEIKCIDAELSGDETKPGNPYRVPVDILCWVSFAAVVVGLWAFAFFALVNVEGGDNAKKDVPNPPKAAAPEGKKEGREEKSGRKADHQEGDEVIATDAASPS